MTKEQRAFEQWLWIEVLLIYGLIFSAILYSFCHSFRASSYQFSSPASKYMGQADFLNAYSVTVDLASLNCTPAFIIFMLKF